MIRVGDMLRLSPEATAAHMAMVLAMGLAAAGTVAWPRAAAAQEVQEVGLGLALGASYSPTAFKHGGLSRRAGDSLAGGFFVDVPISQHLVLSPGATLWGADLGDGKKPATDLDLVIKLRLPWGAFRLGAGVGAGLSHLENSLAAHLTAVASGGLQLSPRTETFVMMAYKHVVRSAQNLENLHGLAGVIFFF